MPTPVSLFDYELPKELIAQLSMEPRDHSRLMVVDRGVKRENNNVRSDIIVSSEVKPTEVFKHKRFYDIVDELRAGDVLVMNNTKVFRARLEATVQPVSLRGAQRRSNPSIELFLLRPRDGAWEALVKPGRHVHVGDTIRLGELAGNVVSKSDVVLVQFDLSDQSVVDYANAHGKIPIPPYVHELPEKLEQYQTVYAQETGSVAAPTAGFHFTMELLEKIRAKGVEIHEVTLHVGLGTFRPVKSETLEEHEMHSEFVTIDSTTAQAINQAKQEGRRVIAVGTTTVRTLEGVYRFCHPERSEGSPNDVETPRRFAPRDDKFLLPEEGFTGDVNLFITPGFEFRVVDALITNFHLPKSTLLVLVSAFAGREHVLAAYHEAIRERYRFFSFGDAMFIR